MSDGDQRLPAWCPTCHEPLTIRELVGAICQRCGCWFHHPLLEFPVD
jgi:hypothetical protein